MTLSSTFAALGDDTRFAIVERLLTEGELSAGDLNKTGNLSPPAISRHLKVLRLAGVISQRIDKQRRLYSVSPKAIRSISAWTMTHRAFWEESLDRFEKLLLKDLDNNG